MTVRRLLLAAVALAAVVATLLTIGRDSRPAAATEPDRLDFARLSCGPAHNGVFEHVKNAFPSGPREVGFDQPELALQNHVENTGTAARSVADFRRGFADTDDVEYLLQPSGATVRVVQVARLTPPSGWVVTGWISCGDGR